MYKCQSTTLEVHTSISRNSHHLVLRDLDGLEVSLCYRGILVEGTFCMYTVQVGLFSKFVIIKYHGLGYKISSLLAES